MLVSGATYSCSVICTTVDHGTDVITRQTTCKERHSPTFEDTLDDETVIQVHRIAGRSERNIDRRRDSDAKLSFEWYIRSPKST
eukprot:5267072-Amphidinium_carterae.1